MVMLSQEMSREQGQALLEAVADWAGMRIVVGAVVVMPVSGGEGLVVFQTGEVREVRPRPASAPPLEDDAAGDRIVAAATPPTGPLREMPPGVAHRDPRVPVLKGPWEVYGEGPFWIWHRPTNVFAGQLDGGPGPEEYTDRRQAEDRVTFLNLSMEMG